ncbi:MAG: DEAD/DEAH box helicase [Flavobacteriales bacterium]|nr:DEAD/DEAH box helicase [Flavobacteriales bacterium]
MIDAIKNQEHILQKMGIEKLNDMQEEAMQAIHANHEIVLLSPTGSGKTLAFLLPVFAELDPEESEIQVLILVPSRELAIQIEQVAHEMGTGHKINAVYGGRAGNKDKHDIKHRPAVLIGTPGRVADHIRRENFSTAKIRTLVLDEFDKSLEVGFESEMVEILASIPKLEKKILTSATYRVEIPTFVELHRPAFIDFSEENTPKLDVKLVVSPEKDKLDTLVNLLGHIGKEPGIIFCNFKDTIATVSDFLTEKGIAHGCFYGGLEQIDRERALIKFRNGTHQLILATDLASRGLDIPDLTFIIHYQLPHHAAEFVHRNGRTARMNKGGTAYVLKWRHESLPHFIEGLEEVDLVLTDLPTTSDWTTVFISGGRKDKISKGDIVGLLCKQGKLDQTQLGAIELKSDCAFVSVSSNAVEGLLELVNNTKLKSKKVRVKVV